MEIFLAQGFNGTNPLLTTQPNFKLILKFFYKSGMKIKVASKRALSQLILLFFSCVYAFCQPNASGIPQVYGVRWFLGEHFTFAATNLDDNNEYFVLMFNSDQEIKGDLAVSIAKNKFSCLSKYISTQALQDHHTDEIKNGSAKGDIDETYLHKCIVSNIQGLEGAKGNKTVKYQIISGDIAITQKMDIKSGGYKQTVLFSQVFRLPEVNQNTDILWVGDWGQLTQLGLSKGYFDVKPCMKQNLQNNSNLVMAFFLGDLAYDLQGPLYYSMLKHIQFITSKMVFMVTPGNHDTLYHADTFQLFVQSFYTPQWKQYSNYFYTLKVGKLAFVAYNPERQIFDFKRADRLQLNFTQVFQKEFPADVLSSLSKDFFTIVFSHYPIYCSKKNDSILTCDKNLERLATYLQYFNKMNMKLYFSGHIHVYERTKPICPDGTFSTQNDSDTYNSSCPVYVVEGAGGNDLFVETISQYPSKDFTKKLVYNSGFGILSVAGVSQNLYPANITYRHYSAQKCNVSDQFTMFTSNPAPHTQEQPNNDSYLMKIVFKMGLVSFSIFTPITLALYIYKKCKQAKVETRESSDKPQQGHIQMVQQHIQAPKNQEYANT